jgi:hypothetical protein
VPSLVGLLSAVLVAAPPQRPGVAVRLVAAGLGDDGAAELSQQLRRHDGNQFEHVGAAFRSALPGAAAARNAQASRLIAVQRCQEVQVVTWPLSSPLTCYDSW